MEFILSYYRNPVSGLIILLSLIIIIALSQIILAEIKANKTNKNIKEFLKNFDDNTRDYLNKLELPELELMASRCLKAKMYFEGREVLSILVAKNPRNIELLYSLALCYLKLGLLSESQNLLFEILNIKARNEKALLMLAFIYFKLGDLKSVKDTYKSLNAFLDYQDDVDFLANNTCEVGISNTKPNKIIIDDIEYDPNQTSVFYMCNACQNTALFYTPFCSNCFRCNKMQKNIRIGL